MTGGLDTGWTLYPPYSSTYSQSRVTLAVAGVFIAGFASILTGVNFIATVLCSRARNMTLRRLPLFSWMIFVNAFLVILAVLFAMPEGLFGRAKVDRV